MKDAHMKKTKQDIVLNYKFIRVSITNRKTCPLLIETQTKTPKEKRYIVACIGENNGNTKKIRI